MGSQQKKNKKTTNVQVIVAALKRLADQEATKTAIQPAFEGVAYIPLMRSQIDFVNITETIDPSQSAGGGADTTPPTQVLGLIVTVTSDTVLNQSWTANTDFDLDHYNVYRGTTAGFAVTLGVTSPVGTPTGNSFSNTGLTASTTYYYKVSAVDTTGNIGALSAEASATTSSSGSFLPSLELHLNGSFADTSPNAFSTFGSNSNGTITPGIFGSAGWRCNYPVEPPSRDYLIFGSAAATPPPRPAPLLMDTAIGFSVSIWVFPQDISALSSRRIIFEASDDATNAFSIQFDSAGIIYFFVKKAGTDYKREKTGLVTGSWQHIAATFNGSTNTVALYRDAVAGVASVAATQYPDMGGTSSWMQVGYSTNGGFNSQYEGYLDEIRYYKSVVLTPTQVTNLKNTNNP